MNKISIAGTVVASPTHTHTINKRRFYRGIVLSTRLSGNVDRLPFVCEEKHLKRLSVGSQVRIDGCVRTRNIIQGDKVHLDVFIHVRDVEHIARPDDQNEIDIDGCVCYTSPVREVGARKISCIKIANNNAYNKTNYLPCVLWGNDAERDFNIGDEIRLKGRLQSRDYVDGNGDNKTTFEISVYDIID